MIHFSGHSIHLSLPFYQYPSSQGQAGGLLLCSSQVTQCSGDSAQVKHLVLQVTTTADPTGISSTLTDLASGGSNGQAGGGFLSGAQVKQWSAEFIQVLHYSSQTGQSLTSLL